MTGPLPIWCRPFTGPLSWIYGIGVRRRNARFDQCDGVTRVARPVISVGNITAGGTGKTPMVQWICNALRDADITPAIAMRGYGAGDDGQSDEALEHQRALGDIAVAVDPDRVAGVQRLLDAHPEVACIVLDDGFQHRAIARDFDVVLIDATRQTMTDRLLPSGWLREPLTNLRRADAVVVTRAGGLDDEQRERLTTHITKHHGKQPMAWCDHHWSHLEICGAGDECGDQSPDWLRGKRLTTMPGIGHPESLHTQLESFGATVVAHIPVRDHERYTRARVQTARALCAETDGLVVTGKDWVKLEPLLDGEPPWPVPIIVPGLTLHWIDGEDTLRQAIVNAASDRSAG